MGSVDTARAHAATGPPGTPGGYGYCFYHGSSLFFGYPALEVEIMSARCRHWGSFGSLVVTVVLAAGLLSSPVAAAPEPPTGNLASVYPSNQVLGTVFDRDGRYIQIRRGFYNSGSNQGFGFDKAYNKHGLTDIRPMKYVFRAVIRSPDNQDFRYTAYAREFVCNSAGCTVRQEVTVRGIFDPRTYSTYYGLPVGGVLGQKTMYCIGYNPRCPSWVTVALINAYNNALTLAELEESKTTGTFYSAGYESAMGSAP
ncbi:MAG: hypothetical protein H7Y15_08305 [Pseudonocardia sp.]|nr:hypothetical protein [Pseudonocardia sp.]